jgi:hypothetical protein
MSILSLPSLPAIPRGTKESKLSTLFPSSSLPTAHCQLFPLPCQLPTAHCQLFPLPSALLNEVLVFDRKVGYIFFINILANHGMRIHN